MCVYLYIYIYMLCVWVCVRVCTCKVKGQLCGTWSLPSFPWVLGIELRLLGLVAGTCCATLPTLKLENKNVHLGPITHVVMMVHILALGSWGRSMAVSSLSSYSSWGRSGILMCAGSGWRGWDLDVSNGSWFLCLWRKAQGQSTKWCTPQGSPEKQTNGCVQ